MKKEDFTKKIKTLFVGKQSFRKRFWTALLPALSLSFILFFFGPLDLSHIAADYVDYSVPDILPACLAVFGAVFGALFLFTWILGGKLHVWFSSLFAGLALAFYFQGNWLNIDLGALDGTAVEWQKYGDNALIGLAVFSLIVLIPYLLHFFSRKLWKGYVIFTSVLLIVMQGIPLGMMLINEFRSRSSSPERYLMIKDKEYVLGKENIVVFILDYTGPEEMKALLDKYPGTLDPFHDFTGFDNYNTEYLGTFPAAAYLLTHTKYNWEIRAADWFREAWQSEQAESFYTQMKDAGWTTRVFHSARLAAGTLKNEYGKISNVEMVTEPQTFTINHSTFRRLIKLSFYRYFPLIMKAPFWLYTSDLNGMKNLSENEQTWNGFQSVQKYLDKRLTVGDEDKVYVSYHYRGGHGPFALDITGRFADRNVGVEEQLAGHFYMISEYIQQMKDYHVYDDSTIIITTDHGNFNYPHGILFIKPAGQRQNEMNISHAPVSQSDYLASIAEFAGLDHEQFGQSYYDIPENEERLRCTYIRWDDPSLPAVPGKKSNAIQELCYTGDSGTLHQMIVNEQWESFPAPYPYY